MNIKNLMNQFTQSSPFVKLALVSLAAIWLIAIVVLLIGASLFLERPSQALQPTPGANTPAIFLAPDTGSAGSSVTVQGESWPVGSSVLIYLSDNGLTDYALASALVDEAGRFSAEFVVPSNSHWLTPGTASVIARSEATGVSAQAVLNIVAAPELPTQTPVSSPTLESTPTATSSPAPTSTPTTPAQPGIPRASVTTDLNVRQGPGTNYPVLGLLQAGQTAEITGRSADGGWWQIKFSGAAGERGWISARYANAQDTGNVPVVQAPAPPAPTATPIPRPTEVIIRDWRGEYYSNPTLTGAPVLVRNDVAISFNWGYNAPASGLPADNFSARWSRSLNMPGGLYRIYIQADDGVRLWVDGRLIIDEWHDSSPVTYVDDVRFDPGRHDFRIEYYERSGGAQIDLYWQRLNDTNQAPQAIAGGPYIVREGSSISLDGSRSKDPDGYLNRYEWDFNYDGRTFTTDATGKYPPVSYPDGPANYTVALRVIDDRGAVSAVATTWISVENVAPGVEAGGPYSGQPGQAIRFAGTAADASPTDQGSLSYRWDFGDGITANGPVVDHTYVQAGNYTARLTVFDKDGAQGTDTATVQVRGANQTPLAVIKGPGGGRTGENLSFSGSESRDPDGNIVSYTWNFGDGTTANGVNVSHSYSQPGDYHLTLTVVDNGGAIGSSGMNVHIDWAAREPLAKISGSTGGLVGTPLNFSGSDSSDPDGSIVSYTWDFGDGTTGSGVDVSHTYTAYGTYQVTLTVTDNDGLTGQTTRTVTIDEIIQIELPPTAVMNAPGSGSVNQNLVFDASDSSDSDGTIVAYTWDFGDGAVESGPTPTSSHSYAEPGVYTVTLIVVDDDGLSNTATQTVTITQP